MDPTRPVSAHNAEPTPPHQIRASFDAETITAYQAYDPALAEPALAAQTFVPPFKRERMTWVKPSFLWMMHRSGWAAKPGQARVLAVSITREGFAWALHRACPSKPAPGEDPDAWKQRLAAAPVRLQRDPDTPESTRQGEILDFCRVPPTKA